MAETKRVQIRFPEHLKREIEKMAEAQGKTEGKVVVELVERALSVDPVEMNKRVIAMHETIESLLERIARLEGENK